MSHIFISYKHKDDESDYDDLYTHRLVKRLKRKGFDVWIDDKMIFSQKWQRVIKEKIDTCEGLVVIMTERAENSDWVQNELTRAIRKQKPIFGVLLDGDIWFSLEIKHLIDMRKYPGKLPPKEWYADLNKIIPGARTPLLTPKEMEEERQRREQSTSEIDQPIQTAPEQKPPNEEQPSYDPRWRDGAPPPDFYSSLVEFSFYEREGSNDFLGITILAMLLYMEGSYLDAIRYLKRALKLEPRLRDHVWMQKYFGWDDFNNQILEELLADPTIDNRIVCGWDFDVSRYEG